MRKLRTFDEYLHEVLKDPTEAAHYLNAVIEENDPALLMLALSQVARAHGMSQMAKRTSLSRMGLYKSLSKTGNPELKTFLRLLKASGLQLSFVPLRQAA